MSHFEVLRWADRIYIKDNNNVHLGYWDCQAGVACIGDEINRPAFEQALARYQKSQPAAGSKLAELAQTEADWLAQTFGPTPTPAPYSHPSDIPATAHVPDRPALALAGL